MWQIRSGTSLVLQSTDVSTTKRHSIWSTAAFQSQTSPVVSDYVPHVVVCWWYHAIDVAHSAFGHSQSPDPLSGTCFQTNSETLIALSLHSDSHWRHSSSTSISVLQHIRNVTIMRCINLHFTYLLTYLLSVPFSALTLMVGWQEGHLACKKPIPLTSRGSHLERVEEDPRGTTWPRLTWIKQLLNGSSSSKCICLVSSHFCGITYMHSVHVLCCGIHLFITVVSCIVLKSQSRSSSIRDVIVAKTSFLVTDVGQTF